ncbi:hypothetical protein [Comamonas testosteroni]|uniref:hypothetical protein n=1 Tax=Comamonas testosteroni TaxID=285 RepID=UPI00391C8749
MASTSLLTSWEVERIHSLRASAMMRSPISRALDALERQKEQTPKAKFGDVAGDAMSQALPKDSQTVFVDPTHGESWADDKRFRNHFWVPMLKALGIRYRRPNHMRHTYATMLLMAAATPACAAKQMRHSGRFFERLFQVAERRSGGHRAGEAGVLHRKKLPWSSPEKTKIVISLCS